MTKEECIALLYRYAKYDGMGIPNLAGCREAMKMAAKLLSQPSLPSNLDEAAEAHRRKVYSGDPEMSQFVREVFKAGAEWMAGQGITFEGKASRRYENGLAGFVSWILFDQQKAAHLLVNQGEEADVIINIRKK